MTNIFTFSKEYQDSIYSFLDSGITLSEYYKFPSKTPNAFALLIKGGLAEELKELESLKGFISRWQTNAKYPALLQNKDQGFTYNDIEFSDNHFNIIGGLNAVDDVDNIQKVFAFLESQGLSCARMGAYKPRTNPYTFQGHGVKVLSEIFSIATEHNIRAIAMEVVSCQHVDEVLKALEPYKSSTGVILQVGTRNAQNFELLKHLSTQEHPVLYKRGFGITLDESIQACEYLAQGGNDKIIFCLRGVKSLHAHNHRNLCDFSQIPMIKRELGINVCADPSHSVGMCDIDNNGISDIAHVSAQAIISGANDLLVDIHPEPSTSLVDSKQILNFEQFDLLLDDIKINRDAFNKRRELYRS